MPQLLLRAWHSFQARLFPGRQFSTTLFPTALTALLGLVVCPGSHAAVGVVLNESLHESMDRITGTGHTAVYFSNICPESPIKLRLCNSGEMGSVMSIYVNIGEDHPYGWNIVPLSIYLYGVEDPGKRPIFGSYKIKGLLEERYRANYLSAYCASAVCQSSPKAEWREMVAATLIRSVYIFAVDTSEEQDRHLIAEFNDSVNKNEFNGVTRNCADFTRRVINTYFPHAVHRDVINDFGMTSPKAVARTFTRYALHHPESNFRVLHFAQVPGTIKRSSEVRAGTEQLVRSKKWLVPMLIFADHELPFVATTYLLTGRFNPGHTFEQHPAVEPGVENLVVALARPSAATPEAKLQLVGTVDEWKQYHHRFDTQATEDQSVIDRRRLPDFFKFLDEMGTASVDKDGAVWMEFSGNGEPLRLGLSANNAVARESNPYLSFEFMLAHTSSILDSPKHSRETMLEFRQDWARLQSVSAELNTIPTVNSTPPARAQRPITFSGDDGWGFAQNP